MAGSKCTRCACSKTLRSSKTALSSIRDSVSHHNLPRVQQVSSISGRSPTLPYKVTPPSPRSDSKVHFGNRSTKKCHSDSSQHARSAVTSQNSINFLEQLSTDPTKVESQTGNNVKSCSPTPQVLGVQHLHYVPKIFDHSQIATNYQNKVQNNQNYQTNQQILANIPKLQTINENPHQKQKQQNKSHGVRTHNSIHIHSTNTGTSENSSSNSSQTSGTGSSGVHQHYQKSTHDLTLGKRSCASIETRNSYIIRKFLMSNKGRIKDSFGCLVNAVGPNGTLKSSHSKISENDKNKLEYLMASSSRSNSSDF